MPDKKKTYVFAIVAIDDSDNQSELSNVVSAKLVDVDGVNVGMIAGITVGVVVVVLLIVIIGVLLAKGVIKPRRSSKDIDNIPSHGNKAYLA